MLNLKVHYCADKSLPLLPILNHKNSVHIHPSYFFKTDFNISHSPTARSMWYYSWRFTHQNSLWISSPTYGPNFHCRTHIQNAHWHRWHLLAKGTGIL